MKIECTVKKGILNVKVTFSAKIVQLEWQCKFHSAKISYRNCSNYIKQRSYVAQYHQIQKLVWNRATLNHHDKLVHYKTNETQLWHIFQTKNIIPYTLKHKAEFGLPGNVNMELCYLENGKINSPPRWYFTAADKQVIRWD